LPLAGLIYTVLGELAYEANELTQARQHLQTGLDLGRLSATTAVILYALEAMARLACAAGEIKRALTTIQEAKDLAYHHARHLWYDAVVAVAADLQLRAGNHAFVEQWAENANLPLAESPDPVRKIEYRVLARFLLAQNRLEEVQALLAGMERSARQDDRRRDLITIHILQALGRRQQGKRADALTNLEHALRLAAPEGYVRAFLDEAAEVAELLPDVRPVAPSFVDGLLTAFGVGEKGLAETAVPAAHLTQLVDPLTERELEVLRLMAADLFAPDIAEELVIAVSTVRSHIKSIYRKLDVHSRYEAVERARALNLL
jgi:LuxR family maltose regulon positive regulatory protein